MKKLKMSDKIFIILTISLCVMLVVSISFNTFTVSAKADTTESNAVLNSSEVEEGATTEIISYNEVFKYYFNKIEAKGIVGIDINRFMNMYYAQEESIDVFTNSIVEANGGYCSATDLYESEMVIGDGMQPISRGVVEIISPDENYILGKNIGRDDFTSSEYFKRNPIYEAFDYAKIYSGDIIYEGGSKSSTKHAAFVYNCEQPYTYGTYVQTIEAVLSGVQFGFLDDDRITRFGVSIYRIYRAGELGVVTRAREFIREQVGKNYSYAFGSTKTSRDSNSWYCSELIFAAYWFGGIDICSNRNFEFTPESMPCLPVYLTRGMYSMYINVGNGYLMISIDGFKSGLWNSAYWEIVISNPNDSDITVTYNTKMCNLEHAKNWTNNLSDKTDILVRSGKEVVVKVYQNFFATSVAVSYVLGDFRYVTYGTDLSKVDYTMTIGNNLVSK